MMKPSRKERAVLPQTQTIANRLLRELRGYLEALAIAFLVVTFAFTTVGVAGSSMEPNLYGGEAGDTLVKQLLVGDRVFIPKYETWLRRAGVLGPFARGDVVVLREPKSAVGYQLQRDQGCVETVLVDRCRPFFIKRIIAVPGDTVAIQGGQVLVNGVAVDQAFLKCGDTDCIEPINFPRVLVENGQAVAVQIGFERYGAVNRPVLPTSEGDTGFVALDDARLQGVYGQLLTDLELSDGVQDGARDGDRLLAAFTIPAGHYFVMGDNRHLNGSEDSRYFGAVPAMSIAGRAAAVIWPPRRHGDWNWRTLGMSAAFTQSSSRD